VFVFTFGPTLCSGPSNIAVDNLAERMDRIDLETCDQYNRGIPPTRKDDRSTRRLIIRGYPMHQEVAAFRRLLENPDALQAPEQEWGIVGKWKFPTSLAFWLLVCLDSRATQAIRTIHVDGAPALHGLRKHLQDQKYEALRDVAAGTISWAEYMAGKPVTDAMVRDFFVQHLVRFADVVCTTPALTESEFAYHKFKQLKTQAVVVDEAGNMGRADLASVWGNTALPCFVAGDPPQLPPTVLSRMEKDPQGNAHNRFANDGSVSALEWFQTSGMTVYRPRFQFRMARGLFDYVGELVYKDVKFEYGPNCGVHLPKFAPCRALEAFIRATDPRVKSPPAGKLLPAFLHYPNSVVTVSDNSTSRVSPTQVEAGLDFIVRFLEDVKRKGEADDEAFGPERVTLIAPYAGNVELINKLLDTPAYASLAGMAPASAVDSFQGREGDVVVLIMGTNEASVPGFTAKERRLHVTLPDRNAG